LFIKHDFTVSCFYKAGPDYGRRVAEGLKLDLKQVERLAKMSHEERAKATEDGTYR
jgi:catalase